MQGCSLRSSEIYLHMTQIATGSTNPRCIYVTIVGEGIRGNRLLNICDMLLNSATHVLPSPAAAAQVNGIQGRVQSRSAGKESPLLTVACYAASHSPHVLWISWPKVQVGVIIDFGVFVVVRLWVSLFFLAVTSCSIQ